MKLAKVAFNVRIDERGFSGTYLDAVRNSVELTRLPDGAVLVRRPGLDVPPVIVTANNIATWIPHEDDMQLFHLYTTPNVSVPEKALKPANLKPAAKAVAEG